ncbi:MAG: hypothetical protein ABEJ40_05710 [Haloarculaceae archaeon]
MSLKCSLLGHSFGETTVEREREEEGSEVVITITELETCTRCGETRVVSENKEVTALEAHGEGPATDAAAGATGGPPGESGGTHPAVDPDADVESGDPESADEPDRTDDAEILGDDGTEGSAQAQARSEPTNIPDAEGGEASAGKDVQAGEEDAVIIDAEEGEETRAGPDQADAGESEEDAGAWPESEDGTEEPAGGNGDAERVATDVTGPSEGGRTPGAWPEEDDDADAGDAAMDEWPEETKRDVGDEGDAGPAIDETTSEAVTVPEGMYKCSECGFTTEVESSSLRAGDFCPECRRGTLVQREDAGS